MSHLDAGKGPAVVLLHAFGTDRRLWQAQVEGLSSRYRVIAPDMLGFGETAATEGSPISMDRYADVVLALMDELDVKSASLVGLSVGGYLALSIALRFPQRVETLVLANTRSSADNDAGRAGRLALVQAIREQTSTQGDSTQGDSTQGARVVVDAYGDRLFGSVASRAVRDTVRDMMLAQPATSLISATLGMAQRDDNTPKLARIVKPTLVLTGSADVLIPPAVSRELHTGIAGAAWVELPGAGHLSAIESPGEFNQAVAGFLAGH